MRHIILKKISIANSLFLIIIFFFLSCQKMSDNGDFDGFWQLTSIKDKTTDTEQKTNDCYLSFYLDMMSLQKGGTCFGRFEITDDSLKVNMINGNLDFISNFGFESLNENFAVNKISSKYLVLESKNKIISYRKW
ncbi:MAG: lipocalin-like domain-containing protein [Bacteroidales bacterium]|nr:lipocalin-like domain-containing protein [Bacteroidales bacterium]